MSVIDRLNSSNGRPSAPDTKAKQQGKKQAKREAKLMLKVEQARKDVEKAEGKVSKAQAKLDDSRKQLHDLEEKLAALRAPQQQTDNHGSTQVQQENPQDTSTPTHISTMTEQGQQAEQGQPGGQGGVGEQLPPDETYVGGAVDTERASTPYSAISDIQQSEAQEQYETDAVARDMVQAEGQGVVSVPPDNQHQESNPEQSQTQGQHSNTFFESRSDDLESEQDTNAAHEKNQSSTSSDDEEQHLMPDPSDLPWQHNPTTDDE